MAAPRLPFLWPMLWKTAERTTAPEIRPALRRIHVTSRRRQEVVQQRYGSANQPPPHLGAEHTVPKADPSSASPATAKPEENKSDKKSKKKSSIDTKKVGRDVEGTKSDSLGSTPEVDAPPKLAGDRPVESLLDSVPDPAAPNAVKESQEKAGTSLVTYEEHQPPVHVPHMEAPRYVHHFDTYGLVKRLEESGWKNDQSITVMKAVRVMLADNMALANEALVSKSQVENETYLFKAACSELRTEVMTRRKAEQDKMRTERTQLQHELDILNQRLGQEGAALKDDLKGMFDDRKMITRNEQREMEGKIQELNYKITVNLQADSKSDVEALRWIMTRRVIITLGLIVVMVLSSLKLYSNALHEKELENKRRARMRDAGTQAESVSTGTGTDPVLVGGEMLVKEGDNPAYVSLG